MAGAHKFLKLQTLAKLLRRRLVLGFYRYSRTGVSRLNVCSRDQTIESLLWKAFSPLLLHMCKKGQFKLTILKCKVLIEVRQGKIQSPLLFSNLRYLECSQHLRFSLDTCLIALKTHLIWLIKILFTKSLMSTLIFPFNSTERQLIDFLTESIKITRFDKVPVLHKTKQCNSPPLLLIKTSLSCKKNDKI